MRSKGWTPRNTVSSHGMCLMVVGAEGPVLMMTVYRGGLHILLYVWSRAVLSNPRGSLSHWA